MKKLLQKRFSKKTQAPSRITNETVAEHRERIIAGGKRYKYPLQYTRRKLIVNTVIIGSVSIALLLLLGWWQLYVAQNSSAFFYRITRIAPLPVASVDGEAARYSDYLLNYRASEHYLSRYDEIRPDSEDGKLQLQYKRREALDVALADAFARKIAKEHDLTVTQDEVDEVLSNLRSAANGMLSEETSNVSSQRVLGLSADDLEILVRNSLLRAKAAFAVDERAESLKSTVAAAIESEDGNLAAAAEAVNSRDENSVQYGRSGLVNTSASFGGISVKRIAELEVGEMSKEPLQSVTTDGYFFVKVTQKNDTQVNFEYIRIPLSSFNQHLETLKTEDKVNEYITIKIDQPEDQTGEEE